MRQKNCDGAEVVWNDPEKGHIQRPPSGVHCSVCSCSPGKLHLVVEIYGQSCNMTPHLLAPTGFNPTHHQSNNLPQHSTVQEVEQAEEAAFSKETHFDLRVTSQRIEI